MKTTVWCVGGGKEVDFDFGNRVPKSRTRRKTTWFQHRPPKHVRCPDCGQRFKPTLHDCEFPYPPRCLHLRLPPHKAKVTTR